MRPKQTVKMKKVVLRTDSVCYRGNCTGITFQFWDRNRVGREGAGEESEEKQAIAAISYCYQASFGIGGELI